MKVLAALSLAFAFAPLAVAYKGETKKGDDTSVCHLHKMPGDCSGWFEKGYPYDDGPQMTITQTSAEGCNKPMDNVFGKGVCRAISKCANLGDWDTKNTWLGMDTYHCTKLHQGDKELGLLQFNAIAIFKEKDCSPMTGKGADVKCLATTADKTEWVNYCWQLTQEHKSIAFVWMNSDWIDNNCKPTGGLAGAVAAR